jgi:orotidine-5'-phosphate decarboxylase
LVKNYNCKVFLDLKLHDIPNTVKQAVKQMVSLNVDMLTVHVQGGQQMMKEAVKTAEEESRKKNSEKPLILGITVLSSLNQDDLVNFNIDSELENQVVTLSRLAKSCNLDGVIASAQEAESIRNKLEGNFIIATPGIRPKGSLPDDQKRVATCSEAIKKGADYIIVGRPIIDADNPKEVVKEILENINRG